MSQRNTPKKKVVVPTQKSTTPAAKSPRKAAVSQSSANKQELVLGRQNYMLIGVGGALVALGLILMSGGQMPSPEVWDENIIYSFRRITLAPLVILAGLVVGVVAIFKQ